MGKEAKKKKPEGSVILESNVDQWHNIKDIRPAAGQHVAIRLVNKQWIYRETEEKVYYVEDEKHGVFVKDYNKPDDITKGRWVIDPPHPKYDYSPISKNDKLLKGTVVTHWREITDEEVFEYQRRLSLSSSPVKDYEKLRLEVDEKHEELVYRALVHAAASLGERAQRENDQMFIILNRILYDLVACIDSGEYIEDGGIKKLYELKDPENEDPTEVEEEKEEFDKSQFIKDTLTAVGEITRVYLEDGPESQKMQAKLLYEYLEAYQITREECESLLSVFNKIHDPKEMMDMDVSEDGGSEVYDALKDYASMKDDELNPDKYHISDYELEAAEQKIKKLQDEMQFRIIDGEAYHMIDMFNSDMRKLGVPLCARIDEEAHAVVIRPNEDLANQLQKITLAAADDKFKDDYERMFLIRYPQFMVDLIEKGLVPKTDIDFDLYVNSKKYYDSLPKDLRDALEYEATGESSSGIVQDVMENCGKEALKSAKHIKAAEELKEKGDVKDDNGSE